MRKKKKQRLEREELRGKRLRSESRTPAHRGR
jgi:hypothetical protein